MLAATLDSGKPLQDYQVTIRPKPDDIGLLGRLIEMHDAAHLAGIRDEPFRLFEFNGSQSVLFSPGRNEGINISTLGMRRLEDLNIAARPGRRRQRLRHR
jgi:hypothetical protein